MQWLEIKVTFDAPDPDLAVDLITDLFIGLGCRGVVVDDPSLDGGRERAPEALPPPARPAVTAYLPADERIKTARAELNQQLTMLAGTHHFQFKIDCRHVDEQDWAESWKAFFQPQKISSSFVVKPTWRGYTPEPGEQIIEIDPGMAFGTGTHPTTALCVQLLEKYMQSGQRVLDVGTGSGILLIAAAKLGASRLTGVDNDPLAVRIARENMQLNKIHSDGFELLEGHLADPVSGSYDLIVANILADVIVALVGDLGRIAAPGAIFICSGIIQTARLMVVQAMENSGFTLVEMLFREEWVAMAARYNMR